MTNDRRLTPVNRAVIGQIVPQLEDTQMLQVDVYVWIQVRRNISSLSS